MARSTDLWRGKNDDTPIPPRVRLRIFERAKGICWLCEQPIKVGERWEADHVVALVNSGANAEENLAPAHEKCHDRKSAGDLKEKSKVAAVRKKHLGITRPAGKIKSPGFPKSEKSAKRQPKPPVVRQWWPYQPKEETHYEHGQ